MLTDGRTDDGQKVIMPAQDLNNQGRKLQNGVRKSFLNVICLLNVLYILVKYHENILTCFKVMVCTNKIFTILETRGDNSWTKSVRVVFPVPDTLPNALYNLTVS